MSSNAQSSRRGRLHIGIGRFSAVELLICIGAFILLEPFLGTTATGDFFRATLLTFVMASAVLAVGKDQRVFLWAIMLMLPAFCGRWASHFIPHLIPKSIFLATSTLFVAYIIYNLLNFVMRSPRVDKEVLCASIAAYLMMGLAWAFCYLLIVEFDPDAFSINVENGPKKFTGEIAVYFSLVTLTTVGFGDVTPITPVARTLTVLEAMTGLLYIAVLVSRLVSLYTKYSNEHSSSE